MKNKQGFWVIIVILYLVVFSLFQFLQFDIRKDELHFWPTSLLFSHTIIPSIDQLRNYNELSTPLPFIIFGGLEYLFHGGIFVGRLINYILSFLTILIIGVLGQRSENRRVLAVLGLLAFPYYWAVAIHLYTDMIAAFLVLLGVMFYKREWHILSSVSFILAISSRQYMLVFPVAVFIYELSRLKKAEFAIKKNWIAPLIASLSIVGWFLVFGGLAPQQAVQSQAITTVKLNMIFIKYSLYSLSCIGLYFVLPEAILFKPTLMIRNLKSGFTRKNIFIALLISLLFFLFPPFGNSDYPINTMGYLDKATRILFNDFLRVVIFCVFAVLACVRFNRFSLASLVVFLNSVFMMKAHIAWDKYVLSVLVTLWFLKSIDALDE